MPVETRPVRDGGQLSPHGLHIILQRLVLDDTILLPNLPIGFLSQRDFLALGNQHDLPLACHRIAGATQGNAHGTKREHRENQFLHVCACCYFSHMAPLVVILLLIVINGIFVMAEMAVVSSRRPRLQQLANEGSGGAQIALDLATNPDRFLATTQIGITLIAILAGAYGERTLTSRLSGYLESIPSVAPYRESLAFGIVVVGIMYISLVAGELLPKRLALHNSERIAASMSGFMQFISRLCAPLV